MLGRRSVKSRKPGKGERNGKKGGIRRGTSAAKAKILKKRKPTVQAGRGHLQGWRLFWHRLVWRGSAAALLLGSFAVAYTSFAYKVDVIADPGSHVSREAIMGVIAQESPVMYRDGETRMGVFFSKEHREHIPYAELPVDWVNAIVASEDQRFFEHMGLDPMGIARAMRQNFKAMRIVAGGSTLTQQTAKNIFYRPDRSVRSKWEELLNALRLEAHFSKEEILEFYANQFHVSANGRGLGIAARYFFDKDVDDLTLLECAYIAGMVKAPATYNPFLGNSPGRRAQALQRAKVRTRYVLDRMLTVGSLTDETHASVIHQELDFKRGTFRYGSNVIVDEVAARLGRAPFPDLFARLGIDNLSTAGLQIITTVDVNLQREATYGLWHHLSEIGSLLEGTDLQGFLLDETKAPRHDPDRGPVPHEFRTALVVDPPEEGEANIHLDLGGFPCVVDAEGVERAATILARAEKGEKWRSSTAAERVALVEGLPPGSVLWVSIRAPGTCDIETRPELQGAVLALDEGRILSMVGGNDNRNFNRALHARRQMGSTWKPLLFHAASQLGWSTVDLLDNRENVFHFEGTWYYPRPDHQSEPFVSMAWAGTRSENLASIWLLDHLTDRLDGQEFKKVARMVGLMPGIGEKRRDYITRIRDEYGVVATTSRMPEVAFVTSRLETLGSLDPASREAVELLSLRFGRGVAKEKARQEEAGSGRSLSRKLLALEHNFQRINKVSLACEDQARRLLKLQQSGIDNVQSAGGFVFRGRAQTGAPKPQPASEFADLRVRPWFGALQLACGQADDKWGRVTDRLLLLVSRGVSAPLSDPEEMWVDGRLRVATIKSIRRGMERRLLVFQGVDPYDTQYLQYHPDFRRLVNMRFVGSLARRFGVADELPPAMSMPLGALDISLEELAQIYQGMRLGKVWSFPGTTTEPGSVPGLRRTVRVPSPDDTTLLISEIRDRHGNVLYRAGPESKSTVTDPDLGRLTADILRNVVRWGTGRRALGAVKLGEHTVPLAGKTGTTNSYRNAAFAGYVPKARTGFWRFGEGYTLASYVGYDDNRSMSRGGVRISGASGALPPWIAAAQGMADGGLLGTPEDLVNKGTNVVGEWPASGDTLRLGVLDRSGLVDPEALMEGITDSDRTVLIKEGREPFMEGVEIERLFVPYRRMGMMPPPDEDERKDGGDGASVLPDPA